MISPTTRLPGVALSLPEDFHQLPLDADLSRRVAAQSALLDRLPMADGDRRELVALYLEALAARLRAADVAAAAFCAVRIGDHASTATITVGFRETATTDRTLAVLGAVAALRGAAGPGEGALAAGAVETTEYAGQPAVRWTVERSVDAVPVRELQVLVQAPDVPVAVLVTLATPMLQDWDLYAAVMHRVCTSVRFTPAAEASPDAPAQVLLLRSAQSSDGS